MTFKLVHFASFWLFLALYSLSNFLQTPMFKRDGPNEMAEPFAEEVGTGSVLC
jgi:hypothetical protein